MREFLRRTRIRLTLAVATVFVLVAAVAATAVYLAFSRMEYADIDSSLQAQAQSLMAGLQDSNGQVSFQGADQLPGQSPAGIGIQAVVLSPGGQVLDSSGSVVSIGAAQRAAHTALTTHQPLFVTVPVRGASLRVLAQPAGTDAGTAALVLTRPLDELNATLTRLAMLLGISVAVLAVVVSWLAYRLAGRALQPARSMAATAREISERDLHHRIELDLPNDELGELAATFNGMLQRLESAFTSLQQFTGDAAHELRAPLALLRTELEVSLSRVRAPEEYEATQRLALSEVEHLASIADQLLLLARADAGALAPNLETVDIADLAEETVERWRPHAAQSGVVLEVAVDTEDRLRADPSLLRRCLDNLLDNAVRHAPEGGTVRLQVERDRGWTLRVTDTGPGVPAELRPGIFDRFSRGDAARQRDTGGAGLGLALCAAIARLHGGKIELETTKSGASFAVHLPAAARFGG